VLALLAQLVLREGDVAADALARVVDLLAEERLAEVDLLPDEVLSSPLSCLTRSPTGC